MTGVFGGAWHPYWEPEEGACRPCEAGGHCSRLHHQVTESNRGCDLWPGASLPTSAHGGFKCNLIYLFRFPSRNYDLNDYI